MIRSGQTIKPLWYLPKTKVQRDRVQCRFSSVEVPHAGSVYEAPTEGVHLPPGRPRGNGWEYLLSELVSQMPGASGGRFLGRGEQIGWKVRPEQGK